MLLRTTALWLAVLAPVASAQLPFHAPIPIDPVGGSWTLATGDIDGDGTPDIVTGGFPGSFLANTNGTGWDVGSTTMPYGITAYAPLLGDLDADGDLDVVARGLVAANTLCVAINDGSNSWTVTHYPSASTMPLRSTRLSDMDGDGDLDVVASDGSLTVYLNDGAGAFTSSAQIAASSYHGGIEVADFDGDGDDDVMASIFWPSGLEVFRNDGGLQFTSVQTFSEPRPGQYRAGDLDGDGDVDVAFREAVDLWIMLNDGTGSFAPPAVAVGGLHLPTVFELGDLDADGDLDVVTTGPIDEITIALNDGAANLTVAQTMPVGYVSDVSIRDMDGDGDTDVVMTGGAHNGVIVLLSTMAMTNLSTISLTGGNGQTGVAGLPYPQPLVVHVELPQGGAHVGTPVTVTPLGGGSVSAPTTATTDANGDASFALAARPFFGTDDFLVQAGGTHPGGITATLQAGDVRTIEVVSGDAQSTPVGTAYPVPLVVRVVATLTGVAIPAAPVQLSSSAAGSFPAGGSLTTDASGLASTVFTPLSVDGPRTVSAWTPQAAWPAVFSLTATSTADVLEVVSGAAQTGNVGEDFPSPLVVRLVDHTGVPVPGTTVSFSVTSGGGAIAPATVTTDPSGLASATLTAGPIVAPHVVTVSAPNTGADLVLTLPTRGLSASLVPGSLLVLFQNDTPGVPILLAADAPLPAPGYSPTPWGRLYTSLLAPSATFVALDGLGLFGLADPTLLADPVFARTFAVPVSVTSLTVVFQVYGLDPAQGVPAGVIFSNPVTVTF